jgi:hypothetical protein
MDMSIDEETKKIITELLLYCPRDLEDENHTYRGVRYESSEERLVVNEEEGTEYYTREIGAANLFGAVVFITNYLNEESEKEIEGVVIAECVTNVLVELEKLHIIREIPEVKRMSFSIVPSTKKESFNISVDKG